MADDESGAPRTIDHLFYFVPQVPAIPSTGRYNHAIELPRHAERAELITRRNPPETVAERYDDVHVLDVGDFRDGLRAVWKTKRIVDGAFGPRKSKREVFVTTFHPVPVLAGYMSDAFWAVSVHDDVLQGLHSNSLSYRQISSRVTRHLISRADRCVYTLKTERGSDDSRDVRYVHNGLGCPVELIEPGEKLEGDRLRAVWVGKTRLEEGQRVLVDALEALQGDPVRIDVYGQPYRDARRLAARKGLEDTVTFHGRRPHQEVREAISHADIGLCVLPRRPDWLHTPTVKAREYLAGGAIPILSDFPGLRQLARDNAFYVEPEGECLARTLAHITDQSDAELRQMMADARAHAETMPLTAGRRWWAHQVLGRVGMGYRNAEDRP